jgi:hypothetical protein
MKTPNRLIWVWMLAIGFAIVNATASDEFPPEISACIETAQKSAYNAKSQGGSIEKVELSLQQEIAECTTDRKLTKAQKGCVGLVNHDYTQLARALVANTLTPIEYVRRVQNRTDKMNKCLKDKAWALGVIRGDKDGDLVPDNIDRCNDTKPFEPTDDKGCPVKRDETAKGPSAEEVQLLLKRMGYLADGRCKGAPMPTIPAPIRFSYLSLSPIPSRLEIEFGRVNNQPAECGVLYEVLVHGEKSGASSEDLIVLRFAFRASDDTATPPSPESIKIEKVFVGGGVISHPNLRWKVRAVNGNGSVSPWSEFQKGSFFIS